MKRKAANVIAAGLSTPESNVDQPSRRISSSMVSQIADLEVGETAAKARRLGDDLTIGEVRESLAEMRQEMRNSVTKAAARAKEQTGGEYRVEVFDTHSIERSWFVVAFITRTE